MQSTAFLCSYGMWSGRCVNCSLSGSGSQLVYGRALTKTDKTPYFGQNPSGFNKRYDGWSYESKLSTPIRHTFYWCSKLHLAHNRAINIKNIRQATTNNIGYSNSLRASGCFLCLSVFVKALPYTHIIFTDKLQFILSYNIAMSDIIILLTDSLADSHTETTK